MNWNERETIHLRGFGRHQSCWETTLCTFCSEPCPPLSLLVTFGTLYYSLPECIGKKWFCAGWDSSPPCNCLHFWHTRSCVSRHICAHAGQMLSTPAHAHGVISAHMLADDKRSRSCASCHKCTHVADDKHSRSRASCHKCAHAGT